MASTVLKPYERRKDHGPLARFALFALLVLVSIFYGLMTAVLPMQLLSIPLTPILIMVALILWMLPDIGGVSIDRMQWLMVAFVGLGIFWPYYVAFNIPGLPWITPTRIMLFSLLAIVVFNFSTSGEFRARIRDAWSESPRIILAFWLFWAVTTISLVFSNDTISSINRYFNNQIYWTMMLPLTAMLATRPGFVTKLVRVMVIATGLVVLYSLWENHTQRVVWVDYLPAFLKIDPEILSVVSESQARSGTNIYRVRGPFVASLYFSEFLTMLYPFFLHFAVTEKRVIQKMVLIAGTFGMMVVMYLTNARSAMVGILLASVLYLFYTGWRKHRSQTQSIGGTAILLAYPAVVIVLALIVQFWHRAHVMVLGGGQHAASSNARDTQWAMGWPKLFSHPLGYGVHRGNAALGYFNQAGEGTVDSYFLSVMLDYGLIALPLFLLMFLLPAWLGFRIYIDQRNPEAGLGAPISLALINFCVVQGVLSTEIMMPLAFILAGCIVGLHWQRQRSLRAAGAIPALAVALPKLVLRGG